MDLLAYICSSSSATVLPVGLRRQPERVPGLENPDTEILEEWQSSMSIELKYNIMTLSLCDHTDTIVSKTDWKYA